MIDIMPTLLEAADEAYPKDRLPIEGRGVLPFSQKSERALFWEHEGNRAVRRGKWRLVAGFDRDWELYDLERDRAETVGLAAREPASVRELSKQYESWARRCGVMPWRSEWEKHFGVMY